MQSMKDAIQNSRFRSYVNTEQYNEMIQTILQDKDVKQFITDHQLSDEVIAKGYAKLNEFIVEKKRGLTDSKIEFQAELILVDGWIDVSYTPTPYFIQEQEYLKAKSRIKTLEMPKHIGKLTLKDIDLSQERADVFSYLADFSNQYDAKSDVFYKGAYLYGPYGTGKTHLLMSLAGTLAVKGFASYILHFPSVVVELKSSFENNMVNEKVDTIKKSPILMIDDLGGETMSDWVRDEVLMVILDYRMREQLPTFFTSNLSLEALQEHIKHSKPTTDERKALRLIERITYLSQPILLTGKNRRHD